MQIIYSQFNFELLRWLVTGLILAFAFIVSAEPTKEINWNDLRGHVDPYHDPFQDLNPNQLLDFSIVSALRQRLEADSDLSQDMMVEMQKKEQNLQAQGIDVDYLLEQRQVISALRKAEAGATNTLLDGQRIRIPGYVVPLALDGYLVTEFLLVPVAGACIHVPPPPPNQIIYVNYSVGYEIEGLYSAVWIEGRIQLGETKKELFLVDGSANIAASYSMNADSIEPY